MNINESLRNVRAKLKISQKEMASILGINPRTYASYERGEREPGTALILKICETFGLSSDELLQNTKNSTPIPKDRSAIIKQIAAMPDDQFQEMAAKLEFAGYIDPEDQ